jgi:hypothetical protein
MDCRLHRDFTCEKQLMWLVLLHGSGSNQPIGDKSQGSHAATGSTAAAQSNLTRATLCPIVPCLCSSVADMSHAPLSSCHHLANVGRGNDSVMAGAVPLVRGWGDGSLGRTGKAALGRPHWEA